MNQFKKIWALWAWKPLINVQIYIQSKILPFFFKHFVTKHQDSKLKNRNKIFKNLFFPGEPCSWYKEYFQIDVCHHDFLSGPPHQPAENRLSQTCLRLGSDVCPAPQTQVLVCDTKTPPDDTDPAGIPHISQRGKTRRWLLGSMVEVREQPPPLLKAQQTPYRSALSYQNVCQITRESRGWEAAPRAGVPGVHGGPGALIKTAMTPLRHMRTVCTPVRSELIGLWLWYILASIAAGWTKVNAGSSQPLWREMWGSRKWRRTKAEQQKLWPTPSRYNYLLPRALHHLQRVGPNKSTSVSETTVYKNLNSWQNWNLNNKGMTGSVLQLIYQTCWKVVTKSRSLTNLFEHLEAEAGEVIDLLSTRYFS